MRNIFLIGFLVFIFLISCSKEQSNQSNSKASDEAKKEKSQEVAHQPHKIRFGLKLVEIVSELWVYDLDTKEILESIDVSPPQGIELSIEGNNLIIKDSLGYGFFGSGAAPIIARPSDYVSLGEKGRILFWEYEIYKNGFSYGSGFGNLNIFLKEIMCHVYQEEIEKHGKTRLGHRLYKSSSTDSLQQHTIFFNPAELDITKSFHPNSNLGINSKLLSVSGNILEVIEPAIVSLIRECDGVLPKTENMLDGLWQKWRFVLDHEKNTYTVEKIGEPYKP